MMTEQQMQQLSRDAADKYGIAPKRLIGYSNEFMDEEWLWLHNDSARCFELMVEHEINVENNGNWVMAVSDSDYSREYNKDYNDDKQLTVRVAILKALLAK